MLAQVARKALELMHFADPEAAITAADPGLLCDVPAPGCVRGCYRCLLSYYNQPDHLLIDRTDPATQRALLRMARATVSLPSAPSHGGALTWRQALQDWGLPCPDADPISLAGVTVPLAWRSHLAAAGPGDMQGAHVAAEAQGYTLVSLPAEPGAAPPPALLQALGIAP